MRNISCLLVAGILLTSCGALRAQDPSGSSIPASSVIPAGTETKIKKPKMRYRALSVGLSKPIGAFADDTYTIGFEGAGGGKTGLLLEFSNLRLFNASKAEHGAGFGLTTQFVCSGNLTNYDFTSAYSSGGSIAFGQFKMGPSLALVSRPRLLFDLGATLGYSVNLLGNLYYDYQTTSYSSDGALRYERDYSGSPVEGATGAFTFGLNGNFRAGALLLGLEFNFLKTHFNAYNSRITSVYEQNSFYSIDYQFDDFTDTYDFPLSTIRLKLGLVW